ncbi:MAG: lipid IV(A) palmitoyltransferase PagP [Propionivibrio sp.]
MNPPVRRKPLALLFCCGLASVFAGGHAIEARAQAPAPLRVDPALLGLPPVKPAEAPAPAETAPAPVEVNPVADPVVEPQPERGVAPKAKVEAAPEVAPPAETKKKVVKPVHASPEAIPARAVAPQSDPAPSEPVAAPAPQPVPKEVSTPAVVPPGRKPRESESQAESTVPTPVRQPAKRSEPAAQTSSGSPSASLRVDPRLLGEAAVASTPTVLPTSPADTSRTVAPVKVAAKDSTTVGTRADEDLSWYQRIWAPVANVYDHGQWELYLPLHTHHLRSKYSQEQIDSYQETPYGFGFGRGLYNESGNWEGIFAMGFQDSHFKPSYTAGYGWKATWRPMEDTRVGLGYIAGLMTRSDVAGYFPFPVVLPVASLAYKNLSLETTFVPGAAGAGNIFFIWAKWELGKPGEPIGTPARPKENDATQLAGAQPGTEEGSVARQVPYGPAVGTVSPGRLESEAVASGEGGGGVLSPSEQEETSDPAPALVLRSSTAMVAPPKESAVPRPVFLSAQRMGGEVEREFSAEGEAELRKVGTVLNAERLTYWPIDDEVEAEGNVLLEQGEDRISGPKMRLKLEERVGFFEQPSYLIKRPPKDGGASHTGASGEPQGFGDWSSGFATPAQSLSDESAKRGRTMTEGRGEADRIDFEGENHIRLTNSTYTTCAPGNDDWYAKTESLKLDYDREVGEGTDGTVYFKGVPIFYSPWLSFSLNNERKSGFLAPSFGTSSDNGIELALPYYWNIAPNMDATIAPRVMSKRGVQLNNEFRYLNTAYGGQYQGKVTAEILPDDRLRDGDQRYGISILHNQTTANGFSGLINYNKVSDDEYYTDLSSQIAKTSQTQLLQQGQVSYGGGGWWSATANFQQHQTLQPDADNPVEKPYKLLPQLTLNARKPDLYAADAAFLGQYTHFTREDQQLGSTFIDGMNADRTVLYPQLSLPYVTPGWYVTPKIGVNYRKYSISGQQGSTPDSISVTLPIFSIDSGMTFERSSNWFGRDYTQTLEPRLYYLNVPYEDQSDIPLFDTSVADFNFAQIFSENQFAGWDRISDANQLTAAATTRLLEPSTGAEVMRAMLGQRFYFKQSKVGLNSTIDESKDDRWEKSDVLAAFSGQVLPKVYADLAWQYNLADNEVKRYSMGARYQPEPGKVLNAAYRYNIDATSPIDQIDISGQWPLSGRWHAVGRLNYSFQDDETDQGGRMIESIGGLEYDGGCWVLRGVVRRAALTEEDASTSFFVQLELNDFSRIGSNPLNLLKRNIQGYSLINQTGGDSVLDE